MFGIVALLVACSGRSTGGSESDGAPRGGSASTGGTSSGGTPSTGGTSPGGTTATGGALTGGTGQSGTQGVGGTMVCSAPLDGDCDGVSTSYAPSGPCSTDGASCSGRTLFEENACGDWSAICCRGQWSALAPGANPVCPDPLMPGDPFACGIDGSIECVAGESYCHFVTMQPTNDQAASCDVLCAAADCSCFCTPDDTGSCSFMPSDAPSTNGGCTCAWTWSQSGPRQPGGVAVDCTFYPPSRCTRSPDWDSICADAGRAEAHVCLAPDPPIPGCEIAIGIDANSYVCCMAGE